MKKIYFAIVSLSCVLMTASCSFLTEKNYMEIEKDSYINNPAEAETVLQSLYRNLGKEAGFSYHMSILFNLGTDISQVEGASTDQFRIVPNNAYPTTQAEVQSSWALLYNNIYEANDFLERMSTRIDRFGNDSDRNKGVVYMAEAHAVRALCYFELVRRWGNVPIVRASAESYRKPTDFVQASPEEVYKFIEEDLLYAAKILPYAAEDTYRTDNRYRFSKGAVLGLLTKVYATWAGYPVNDSSKWEKAAQTASQLISSGKHDLLSDYTQLWKNTCSGVWDPTESLVEFSMYSPTAANSEASGRIGKWNGVKTYAIEGQRGTCAGNVKVVHTFVLKWRAQGADPRRDISIANYQYQADGTVALYAKTEADDADSMKRQKEKQNYTPAKWDLEKYCDSSNKLINNDKSNANWYYLRYSDVLLLYAEALNEQLGGPNDAAYAAVNKVRSRAGLSALASGMDQESFRQAVRDERAYELCFEGHRKLDLVRWGIYYDTIVKTRADLNEWWEQGGEANYTVEKYTVKGKHELMPIPQREVDLCKFKQNPLW